MDKFYKTNLEEQETTINIDYYERKIVIYTCQERLYKKLLEKLGEPTKIFYTCKKISGAKWEILFKDKNSIRQVLSRPTLIGQRK